VHVTMDRAEASGELSAGAADLVVDLRTECPSPRTAQDEEDARVQVRDALNDYLSARHRLRRAESSLQAAEDVLASRVHLVRVLTDSGWSPPSSVLAQLALDEALLHEPAREDRVRA
jgi:hypothetical protein